MPQVCFQRRTVQRMVLCVESTTARMTLTLTLVAGLRLWRRSSMLRRDRGGDSWCFCTHSATHCCADCRPPVWLPLERIQQRTVEQIVDLSPGCLWNAFSNAQWSRLPSSQCPGSSRRGRRVSGACAVPHFADCARSDVEGFDDLHQLVWVVEAGGRTVVSPRCGFFRGPVHRHRAQLGAFDHASGSTHARANTTSKPPPPPPPGACFSQG